MVKIVVAIFLESVEDDMHDAARRWHDAVVKNKYFLKWEEHAFT